MDIEMAAACTLLAGWYQPSGNSRVSTPDIAYATPCYSVSCYAMDGRLCYDLWGLIVWHTSMGYAYSQSSYSSAILVHETETEPLALHARNKHGPFRCQEYSQ